MSMPIDLSIIVPVYNTSKYLRKCLDSIFRAIPRKTEVIVINDGSTDNSESIILEYQKNHKNIRYIKQENQGLPGVKNRGLREALGKYVIFIDSDDYFGEKGYSDMLKTAKRNNADLVECAITTVYPDGGTIIREIGSAAENSSLVERSLNCGLTCSSCNKMVKKELYQGLDFPNLHNEDVAVTPILILNSKKLFYIEKPYYYYVQHEDSMNHGFKESRFDIFETTKICIERAKKKSKKEQYMLEGYLFSHQLVALLFAAIAEIPDNRNRKKNIEKFCKKYHELNLQKENLYAKKYLAGKGIFELYSYIEKNDIDRINELITTVKI